jgi:hypothetical protein
LNPHIHWLLKLFQVDALQTKFTSEYKQQKWSNWTVAGNSAGQYKNAGTFSYLRVYQAGHEVSILLAAGNKNFLPVWRLGSCVWKRQACGWAGSIGLLYPSHARAVCFFDLNERAYIHIESQNFAQMLNIELKHIVLFLRSGVAMANPCLIWV